MLVLTTNLPQCPGCCTPPVPVGLTQTDCHAGSCPGQMLLSKQGQGERCTKDEGKHADKANSVSVVLDLDIHGGQADVLGNNFDSLLSYCRHLERVMCCIMICSCQLPCWLLFELDYDGTRSSTQLSGFTGSTFVQITASIAVTIL